MCWDFGIRRWWWGGQRHSVFHGLLVPAPQFLSCLLDLSRQHSWRQHLVFSSSSDNGQKVESDSKQSPRLTPTSQTVWSQRSRLNCVSQVQNPGSITEQPETKQGHFRAHTLGSPAEQPSPSKLREIFAA